MSTPQTMAGAAAFLTLLDQIGDLSDKTAGGEPDGRDYKAITALIEASILQQYVCAVPDRREGYLRAMADLLCTVADGAVPSEGWSPLRNTALAFSEKAA